MQRLSTAIPSPQPPTAAHCVADSQGEAAYALIRREVLSCRLMPGVTVTEPELMARYGLGKSSCRIALTRLVHEGLVQSRPRKGYRIAPVVVKDVAEIFALRVQLEPLAARLAVGRVDTPLLRVELDAPLHERIETFMRANTRFHLAIAQASGNARLLRMLSSLMDEMSRLVALGFNVQRVKPEIKHDHNAIIQAFEEHDSRRVELIARRHIETFQAQTMEKVYASLSQASAFLPLTAMEARQ